MQIIKLKFEKSIIYLVIYMDHVGENFGTLFEPFKLRPKFDCLGNVGNQDIFSNELFYEKFYLS